MFFSIAAQDVIRLRTRGFLTVVATASLVDDNGYEFEQEKERKGKPRLSSHAKSERIKIVQITYLSCVLVHESDSTSLLQAKVRRGKREPRAKIETVVRVVRTGCRHKF
ncbi:hypothetical protein V8G54_036883 [Vigna mungo]|uniref:Uncharacterized protein n=1 Tax=Vigna mungo TaxID=3915 RepID=A0AAQ3MI18_VIGMU